jgi:hypothetical protein
MYPFKYSEIIYKNFNFNPILRTFMLNNYSQMLKNYKEKYYFS